MTKLFHKTGPFSFSIVHIPRKYTDKNTGKKIHSIIAKFKSWKSSKEFYDAKPIVGRNQVRIVLTFLPI